jgi:glycogen synthase
MRVRTHGRSARSGSFRVAFAGALAAGVLTALASVGGLGYAATGASQAVEKAKRVVHVHTVTTIHRSAASDQYRKPKAKCRKGTHRVKGVCKRVKKARGVRFRRPPFTG